MRTSRQQSFRPPGGFCLPDFPDHSAELALLVLPEQKTVALRLPLKAWQTEIFNVTVNSRRPSPVPLLKPSGPRFNCLPLLWVLFTCLYLNATAVEVDGERWRWSNPLPHGNNVLDMLVKSNLAVQVGDAGTVYVQRDGGRWAPAVTGATNYLRGVALMGDRFIVTGENGCILWSDDGKVFQPAELSPATLDWFEGVAASAQRAVAVGDNGSIYTSTNGTSWTKTTSGTTEWLRGVAFGGGTFVAVGENGTILQGSGAASWNRIASGTTAHLNRVRYLSNDSESAFMAVGNGGVVSSSPTGGSGWVSSNSGTTNNLFDVALNDTGVLIAGDQELRFRAAGTTTWTNQITGLASNAPPAWMYLSAGGFSNTFLAAGRTGLLVEGNRDSGTGEYAWQPMPDSSHAWLWDVRVQQGAFTAVGDLATILTSLDGILWAREMAPVSHTNTVLLGVGGNTNLLLAVGNAGNVLISRAGLTNLMITNVLGTNLIITNTVFDTLGVIWTNLPAFTTNSLQGVAASDDIFVLCGDFGSIFTGSNGSNWVKRAAPTANFLSSVTPFPGGWIAAGNRGTLLRSGPDAAGWTGISLGTTNWLYRVRWLGNQLLVLGQNGALYTSENGTNWTARTTGTTRWLNDAAFLAGTWFIVGNQGLLLSSTNLANWTPLPVPTIKSLYSAAVSDGQLVIAGIEGIVLRNQIVSDLTPVNFLGYDQVLVTSTNVTVTHTNFTATAYELFLFGGEPDQFFEFQSSTNLSAGFWATKASLELFDASGTIYLIRSRSITNTPPREFYRTQLLP